MTAPIITDTGYSTDPDPELRNPERGIYCGSWHAGDFHTIVAEWLYLGNVCGEDLTWNGHGQDGTSQKLNDYAQKLEDHRNNGVKVLFRPRYDESDSQGQPSACTTTSGVPVFHADSKARQIDHIDAVAAMLGEYRDVIAHIQAGYLGRWGEWNTANPFNPTNAPLLHNFGDRIDIIEHVLSAYGAAGVLQHVELRTPVFAKEVIDRNSDAKIGLHNDCFMTSNSDSGTYSDFPGSPANFGSSSDAKAWAKSFTFNRSFGGETCPLTEEDDVNNLRYHSERWRFCENMTSEPATLYMNYLNGEYPPDAVKTWKEGDCYDDIRRNLGYRFKVTGVQYTPTVAAGQTFSVGINILHSGWARLHKPRFAKLVLRSGSTTHVHALSGGEAQKWAPGTATQVSVTAAPPPTGTYSVRLAVPDPDNPDAIPYAVRLASVRGGVNVFDESTGENDLGVSITVQ